MENKEQIELENLEHDIEFYSSHQDQIIKLIINPDMVLECKQGHIDDLLIINRKIDHAKQAIDKIKRDTKYINKIIGQLADKHSLAIREAVAKLPPEIELRFDSPDKDKICIAYDFKRQ